MMLRITKQEQCALIVACANFNEPLVIIPDGTSEEMAYAVLDAKVSPERAWYLCKEMNRIMEIERDDRETIDNLFDLFRVDVKPR